MIEPPLDRETIWKVRQLPILKYKEPFRTLDEKKKIHKTLDNWIDDDTDT